MAPPKPFCAAALLVALALLALTSAAAAAEAQRVHDAHPSRARELPPRGRLNPSPAAVSHCCPFK